SLLYFRRLLFRSTGARASDPSAAGPLGAFFVPAPAAVRRSPGAPASRSAPAAACSTRLRALRAERGAPRVAPQLPDREGRRRAGGLPAASRGRSQSAR